jgi:uroporphyrinogen-III synthase
MSELDLSGVRIAVTRPPARSESLVELLRELGSEVQIIPLIETKPPDDDGRAFTEAWETRDRYDWIAFTSASSVPIVAAALVDARLPDMVKIAAVGPATASALEEISVEVTLTGGGPGGRGLGEQIAKSARPGALLVINAQEGRNDLAEVLTRRGWRVHVVPGYATHAIEPSEQQRSELMGSQVVIVASPSTVRSYVSSVGSDFVAQTEQTIVAIGETTGDEASNQGFAHVVVASTPDDDGLLEAVGRAVLEKR